MSFVYIINEIQPLEDNGGPQDLPEAYGPYESPNQAMGEAVDHLRCNYDYPPHFSFQNFGETMDNVKILIKTKDGEEYLAATVNKLF